MGLQPTPPPCPAPSPPPIMAAAAAATAVKRKASTAGPVTSEAVEAKKQCLDDSAVSMEVEDEETSPKVIVEHQPLPSIYELQQNNEDTTAATTTTTTSNQQLLNSIPSENASASSGSSEGNIDYDSGMSDESNSCED